MSDAVTVDTTGGSTTTTQHSVVSSDGKGHDKISVRAGPNSTLGATPPRVPLSQMGTTPRDPSLPPNFKTVQDLVNSYKELQATYTRNQQTLSELQKGFTSGVAAPVAALATTPEAASPVAPALAEPTTTTPPAPPASVLAPSVPIPGTPEVEPPPKVDLRALSEEWAKNGGKLSRRTIDRLEKVGITERDIDRYVEAQTAFADKYRISLEQAAGGSDRLPIVLQWAAANEPEASQRYNIALANEDWQGARLILAGMSANYTIAAGRDPRLVVGGVEAARASEEQPFLSQHEMVRGMSDPRYGKDPAYTRSVERRAMQYAALKRQGKAL